MITFKEQLNEMDMNKKLQFVNSCPQNVFQINKKTNKIELSPNGLVNLNNDRITATFVAIAYVKWIIWVWILNKF